MLQAAGDLGLQQETAAALRRDREARLISFSATSRPSSSSRATDTMPSPPSACGRRMRNRVPAEVSEPTLCGIVFQGSFAALRRGDALQRGVNVGIGDAPQISHRVAEAANRRQALLRIVAVLSDVGIDQGRKQS